MKDWEQCLGDGYEVVDLLKESPDGVVALLYDRIGRQVCVLKQRDLRTGSIYRKLKEMGNPHIPSIYRLMERDGQMYVIEEFIDGRTLADILHYDGGKLDEATVLHVLRELCECLRPVHGESIVHRDIKPSNIILDKKQGVYLVDFGIARIARETDEPDTEFLGTKGYAPPEQYGFGQTDARSDIYSLGMTARRMLGEGYHGCLDKVLQRCTALAPENRYASVDELLQDIGQQQRRWRARRWIAGIGTALLVSAAALWALHDSGQERLLADNGKEEIPSFVEGNVEPETKEVPSGADPQPPGQEPAQAKESPAPVTEKEPPARMADLPAETKPEGRIWKYPQLNREQCTFFLNGMPCETGIPVPAELWGSWRKEGDAVLFPADWTLRLHIDNQSASDVVSPVLECEFRGAEDLTWQRSASAIPSGESADFDIPLGQCKVSGRLCWLGVRLEDAGGTSFYWDFQFYLE